MVTLIWLEILVQQTDRKFDSGRELGSALKIWFLSNKIGCFLAWECLFDLQSEVLWVAVAVGSTLDELDLILRPSRTMRPSQLFARANCDRAFSSLLRFGRDVDFERVLVFGLRKAATLEIARKLESNTQLRRRGVGTLFFMRCGIHLLRDWFRLEPLLP